MRILSFLVLIGTLALTGAPKRTQFGVHDKEYYLDPLTLQFIRPGLAIKIVSANIAGDGTISVDYKVTDPKGVPLDLAGITTPGPISLSFIAAYIPKGQEQYYSYATRSQTSSITHNTAIQAGSDSGGTTQPVATGEYIYTFKTKAVAQGGGGFDSTATHRIGIYGSRNLTEFDLGTNYDDAVFDFVPAGGTPTPRDIIRTQTCNKCHGSGTELNAGLSAHGGSRRSLELCIICHQPQTTDPDTGNTLDMKVFLHRVHMGSELPSVQAGTPYQIIGFNNSVSDWSTVELPSDPRRCQFCHESTTGAAQANAWLTTPTRATCGSCHDNVNFATGKNHSADNIPEVSDNQCAQCHIPQGDLEFDASIKGAHVYPQESAANPGLVLTVQKVDNGGPGQTPTVTFTVKDFKGNGVSMAQLTGGSNRLALVLAGPTGDYGYTSFGSDVTTPGYVSENPVSKASCSPDGTCVYTFAHAIPANATGTYSIGAEGRRTFTINANTLQAQNVNYGADNSVLYFSVDGSPVAKRRTVVSITNCNQCHARLSLHGENRNQIQQCVMCHNPSQTDAGNRANARVPADKLLPPQMVNFAGMIHKIHSGETLGEAGLNYTIVGNGGSHNDFTTAFASVPASIPNTGVRYPAMGPTGATGDTAKCYMCHVQTPAPTEGILPIGKNNVVDPQGLLTSPPATTSACTACHFTKSALAHANLNTDPKFGETCDVCHATGAQFDVDQMHAGK
jgi:OmcA/MtrC family decaheme c-type cytochrome